MNQDSQVDSSCPDCGQAILVCVDSGCARPSDSEMHPPEGILTHDESGKPILFEKEEEDDGGYRPHESLGAAVMQQFGIDPDNVFECTITIETLRHQETVSVKLKVKPPKGSHNALLQRMEYYNLVEKVIKLDGVPEG